MVSKNASQQLENFLGGFLLGNQRDLEKTAQEYFNNPCESNLDFLIKNAQSLICCFARRFGLVSIREDLIQAGYEGLLKAINGYDPSKGVRFTTYASHWIIGEIRHEIRQYRRFAYPDFIANVQNKITGVVDEYFKTNGEFPSPSFIAKEINLTEEGIIEAMRAGIVSFDQLQLSKIQSQKHTNFQLPVEDKIILFNALNSITSFQKKVIYWLFFKDKTQEETAKILKTNQRQVSRIKKKGIDNLRKNLEEIV